MLLNEYKKDELGGTDSPADVKLSIYLNDSLLYSQQFPLPLHVLPQTRHVKSVQKNKQQKINTIHIIWASHDLHLNHLSSSNHPPNVPLFKYIHQKTKTPGVLPVDLFKPKLCCNLSFKFRCSVSYRCWNQVGGLGWSRLVC